MRAPCGPCVSVTERGSHVLSLAFEPQHLVGFHCSQSTDFVFSFILTLHFVQTRECLYHFFNFDINKVIILPSSCHNFLLCLEIRQMKGIAFNC